MTLVKSKREHITILDFSCNELSRNTIIQSLRKTKIPNISKKKSTFTVFDNHIKVGMYNISLLLSEEDRLQKKNKYLRDYGKFQVKINELNKEINLQNDRRFKQQGWIKENKKSNLRINDLVDIIHYCYRLNKLKLFL